VYRLDLYLFYLLVYLQHNGDALHNSYKYQSSIHPPISKPEEENIIAMPIYILIKNAFKTTQSQSLPKLISQTLLQLQNLHNP
jgi:hypothetical protein